MKEEKWLIFILMAFVTCLFFILGCVSKRTYEQGTLNAYIHGLQKARKIASENNCKDAVSIISARIAGQELKKISK